MIRSGRRQELVGNVGLSIQEKPRQASAQWGQSNMTWWRPNQASSPALEWSRWRFTASQPKAWQQRQMKRRDEMGCQHGELKSLIVSVGVYDEKGHDTLFTNRTDTSQCEKNCIEPSAKIQCYQPNLNCVHLVVSSHCLSAMDFSRFWIHFRTSQYERQQHYSIFLLQFSHCSLFQAELTIV